MTREEEIANNEAMGKALKWRFGVIGNIVIRFILWSCWLVAPNGQRDFAVFCVMSTLTGSYFKTLGTPNKVAFLGSITDANSVEVHTLEPLSDPEEEASPPPAVH